MRNLLVVGVWEFLQSACISTLFNANISTVRCKDWSIAYLKYRLLTAELDLWKVGYGSTGGTGGIIACNINKRIKVI